MRASATPSRASSIRRMASACSTTSAIAIAPIAISTATVDRYLAEFERLLEDVSRDERGGQAMVRTYLTSETGKVYTLLAHASGRFD